MPLSSLLLLLMMMCCSFLFALLVTVAVIVSCLSVCSLFLLCFVFSPFAKLHSVKISRLVQYISNVFNLYTCDFFLYISPTLYKRFLLYLSKAQCHFFVYLKVDGGQLESFRYFDHHTHFITCYYCNYLSNNHVL